MWLVRAGVRVTPAKKGARVPRFEYLKQLMVNGEFFVASRCRMWLATVPSLPRDPRTPDDCDSSANDHFLDATSLRHCRPARWPSRHI